jgi:transposase
MSRYRLLPAPAQERRLQRRLARAKRGSNRRGRVRHAVARLRARETDRRKDWAEKVSTGVARRFDVIRAEDLQIGNVTRSAKGTRGDPRESQPRFVCTACGFAGNADVNAAVNIAAGHAVTARGGFRDAGPVNREPQLLAS